LDTGSEFVSRALLEWLSYARIETALIEPGKSWRHTNNESFNGTSRDERLSLEWIRSRKEAHVVIAMWGRHKNVFRLRLSLKNLTPVEFKTRYYPTHSGSRSPVLNGPKILATTRHRQITS
jgi:putative transposase